MVAPVFAQIIFMPKEWLTQNEDDETAINTVSMHMTMLCGVLLFCISGVEFVVQTQVFS